MTLNYPELLIPSIISFAAVLYVVPWHLRIRNIATLSMSFWMLSLNLVHIINPLLWNSDNHKKASVYGDICCTIIVGYNFGLPLSHLLLARQLEALTSLRTRSVLYDVTLKQRNRLIDLGLCLCLPVLEILLRLTQMDRRYWIAQGFGAVPATYWDGWGVAWMAIVPIFIAVGALIYTVMALVNIYLRRAKMLSMVSSDSQTSKEQFIRLYVLSIAELGTCMLRAFFNMSSYTGGPQPFLHKDQKEEKSIDQHTIGHIPLDMMTGHKKRTMYLQWYTVVACSIVFFFCFATGAETTRFYRRMLHKVLPFAADPDRANMAHLTSKGTSTFGSAKPSQISLQEASSGGQEQKLAYDDTGYQLEYITSPRTPTAAHYKDSPTTPNLRVGFDSSVRLDSDTAPFNRLVEVESRAETAGAESTIGSGLDDIEAQKYWDDILILVSGRSESTVLGSMRKAQRWRSARRIATISLSLQNKLHGSLVATCQLRGNLGSQVLNQRTNVV